MPGAFEQFSLLRKNQILAPQLPVVVVNNNYFHDA
jgi:hypothetical protein